MDLSEEMQSKIGQFQQLQQQVQYLSAQRIQLDAQTKEIVKTMEELGKLKEGSPVYRSIGSLLVKVEDVPGMKKELEEQKETLEVRVRTLEKQEKHMREQHQKMQAELEKELSAIQDKK